MQRMKRMKTILALILVFAFVLSFMAMSASAATTVVQPRGTCPSCKNGYISSRVTKDWIDYNNPKWKSNCSNIGVSHAHYNEYMTITATCANCGYVETSNVTRDYCPHA